jgi:ribosomal-protein-alanine N-acetyltransferase
MPAFDPVVLATERLTLRFFTAADAEAYFAIYADPRVTRYGSRGPWTDIEQARENIAQTMEGYATGSALRFAIVLAESGDMIGHASLHGFHPQNRRCEIGYALGAGHWGKGYVTEALRAALDYGFDMFDLNRVEADIDPRNEASARVLTRLGFRKEGHMPERWIVDGEVCDTDYYGLLKSYR